MDNIPLGKYQHYKGGLYELIGVGLHSETHEAMVVYRALYDSEEFGNNALWVRPLSFRISLINSGNVFISV